MGKFYKKWDSIEYLDQKRSGGISIIRGKAIEDNIKELRAIRKGTDKSDDGHGRSFEPKPSINKCRDETVIEGHHQSAIILGQDRPGSCLSGKGGRGDTHAGSITFVAGAGMAAPSNTVVDLYQDTTAAIFTIVQKTDDLPLSFGVLSKQAGWKNRSAIRGVADRIDFRAREGLALHAGSANVSSQGNEISNKAYGIDLIARGGGRLQPIPLGKNLVACLRGMLDEVDRLSGILDAFLTIQLPFNLAVAAHTHHSIPKVVNPLGPAAPNVSPSLVLGATGISTSVNLLLHAKVSLVSAKVNYAMFRMKFLSAIGDGYINSLNNHTN